MPIPKSKSALTPVPAFLPRVEPHARDDRFVFIHECVNGTRRTTVLPVGRSSWTWDRAAGTVTPELHCPSCGTRGSWRKGKWEELP